MWADLCRLLERGVGGAVGQFRNDLVGWGRGPSLYILGVLDLRASRYLCRGPRHGNDYVGGHVGTSAFI